MNAPAHVSVRISDRDSSLWPALATLAVAAAFMIDLFWLAVPLLAENRPAFGAPYLLRTALIAAGSALFVAWAARRSARTDAAGAADRSWDSWGVVYWVGRRDAAPSRVVIEVARLAVLAVALAAIGMVLLFVAKPGFFSRLGMEDGLVETLSAAVLLVVSGMFAWVAIDLHRSAAVVRKLAVAVAVAFSFAFFLIAMEEISWFQRYLGIETPEAFASNAQDELNLHNFATNEIENAYYFSMFLLLILAPFLVGRLIPSHAPLVAAFAPSPFTAYAAALFVGFNYDMWNILLIQLAFFVTLFVLVEYLREARARGERGSLEIAVLFVLVLSQALFLAFGERFVRLHDVTEHKELLIPIACAMYAVDVLVRSRVAESRSTSTAISPRI